MNGHCPIDYQQFLTSKVQSAIDAGFDVGDISAHGLYPFQSDLTIWALKRGRAAIFADTGLGKTGMQVVWAHHVAQHTGRPVLILAPLSVAHQTCRQSSKFGVTVRYFRRATDDISGVVITNYEMMDHFDLSQFAGLVLDESSILKAHTGKTRTAIIDAAQSVPYRLSCTATPSPNDHMELGNQAEFVGVMSRTEMLAMFFTHDGGETSKWRLKGHAKTKFWEWMASWAAVVRKPSDLGYSDHGYNLPKLRIIEHIVESEAAKTDIFDLPAMTLSDQRAAKRASLPARVDACADLVNSEREFWLVWCHLNDESTMLDQRIDDGKAVAGSDSLDYKEQTMDAFSDCNLRVLVAKPSICGFGMNWQHCNRIAFVGLDHSFEQFYQAIRRCWRFGQSRPVDVHVFLSEQERRYSTTSTPKSAATMRCPTPWLAT